MENEQTIKREFSEDDKENAFRSLGIDIVYGFKFTKEEEWLISMKERIADIIY